MTVHTIAREVDIITVSIDGVRNSKNGELCIDPRSQRDKATRKTKEET